MERIYGIQAERFVRTTDSELLPSIRVILERCSGAEWGGGEDWSTIHIEGENTDGDFTPEMAEAVCKAIRELAAIAKTPKGRGL